MRKSDTLLGGISYQAFLDEYWQQKPLLIRQAIPDFSSPFSPEELAGIACDTDAPSRIVIEKGETPWQAHYGPFDSAFFATLPDTHWTLLVNDIERYYPELRSLINKFRFIPDWRVDDLMVSFAVDGGSVGPHTDEYDVLLIQGMGKRHWQIANSVERDRVIPDIELSILQEFDSEQDWVLEPGDMLYLPPNVAHHGIAKDDCMTFSVGFRAPSQRDLFESLLDKVTTSPKSGQRFYDAKRTIQDDPAEISLTDINKLKQLVLSEIDSKLTTWLGEYLTESRGEIPVDEDYDNKNPGAVQFTVDSDYERPQHIRFSWIKEQHQLIFFANGKSYPLPDGLVDAIRYLCDKHYYKSERLASLSTIEGCSELINELLEDGALVKWQG